MKVISARWLACVVLVAAVASCAGLGRKSNFYSVNPDGSTSKKYSRVNEYTSYGQGGLGSQTKIAAAYEDAQHAPAPVIPVEILNATLPAGVTFEHGAVNIAKDAPYEGVGRFELGYWLSSAPLETEIEEDLKRLASVTNANVVVVEVTRVSHADPHVNFVSGILLRRHDARSEPAPIAKAEPPAPGKPRVKARLLYEAKARGCLTATEFADEVSARLGYSPWVDSSSDSLHAEIVQQGSKYRATVQLADGASKELTGVTCKTVTEALISVVLVQLDGPSTRRLD
ncbi:MAG: hypothetical protein H6Q90_2469 [Deltaproteobacteria bacterium]|nr:hypothetical protein [Deltaproteobacteria bacterium]